MFLFCSQICQQNIKNKNVNNVYTSLVYIDNIILATFLKMESYVFFGKIIYDYYFIFYMFFCYIL